MALHRVGEVVHVYHGALDAGIREAVEPIIDQRLAADRDQRFGDMSVIWPHARAETGGQHYRALRHHRVAPPGTSSSESQYHSPSGAGTFVAYQDLSPVKAGCASER